MILKSKMRWWCVLLALVCFAAMHGVAPIAGTAGSITSLPDGSDGHAKAGLPAKKAHSDDPHAADAAHGHAMLFGKMMPAAAAEYRAVASGSWSAAATWAEGKPPQPGGRILIPKGITVLIDREFPDPLHWVRVDGILKFDPTVNTLLTADTIAVAPGGRLEIGTAAKPVKASVTAQLVIHARDGKPIDHSWDPLELGRGLLVAGAFESQGTPKTPFVPLSTMPKTGSSLIVVDEVPKGWHPGDELVLTATAYDQDETFRLVAVKGTQITLDRPVRHTRTLPTDAHGKPHQGLALHLGNLTRNVQVRSSKAGAGNAKLQGHVMLMHGGGHKIAWTGFHDLGRTTVKPVTDPRIHQGKRAPGISPKAGIVEENVRGRYALHFHRAGPHQPSIVQGCTVVVQRGAGFMLGVVNHSSHVSVRDCVSHNIDGSHYFTEEGDELGDFTGNLAVHSIGSGASHDEQPRDRVLMQDPDLYHQRRLNVGHRGTGFWLNGSGVDVVNNVSSGQAHSGFHIWPRPLNFRLNNTYLVRFPATSLENPKWISGSDMDIGDVPIRFNGNVAYVLASGKHRGMAGFLIDYMGKHAKKRYPKLPYSEFYDLLSWNAGGFRTTYTGNIHLKNVRVIADPDTTANIGIGLRTQGGNTDLVEDVYVDGFKSGIVAGANSLIRGGNFTTDVGLVVEGGTGTVIDISGMKLHKPPALSEQPQLALYRKPIFRAERGFNPALVFAPQPVEIKGHPQFPKGAELYSLEQMPDYVLPDLGIPGLLDGKTTTGEAWAKYRLAPGGTVAPAKAAPLPGLPANGVFGPPAQYDNALAYRAVSDKLLGFQPIAQLRGVEKAKAKVEAPATDLKPGWNLLTLKTPGAARTILVHGGPLTNRPRVNAGSDVTVSTATGVELLGTADKGATLRWSRAYGPGIVTFKDVSAAHTQAQFDQPGTYVLHLTARDATGRANTDSIMVIVEAAQP